ncbi:hypothetical protein FZC83_02195 [Rossellomorea marisflavi]|uniref:Uncharacterized protein n=1 Tax=Rossellomorea marisflavi TaxID=189381 RepID=A0A5D4RYJ5_9BACI|nr:hypothetical protein [Rossellomorea marisflavi]TYS56407.1 hypothetical protein FZC83_02195 [Rossellomorea marisflavi]
MKIKDVPLRLECGKIIGYLTEEKSAWSIRYAFGSVTFMARKMEDVMKKLADFYSGRSGKEIKPEQLVYNILNKVIRLKKR